MLSLLFPHLMLFFYLYSIFFANHCSEYSCQKPSCQFITLKPISTIYLFFNIWKKKHLKKKRRKKFSFEYWMPTNIERGQNGQWRNLGANKMCWLLSKFSQDMRRHLWHHSYAVNNASPLPFIIFLALFFFLYYKCFCRSFCKKKKTRLATFIHHICVEISPTVFI